MSILFSCSKESSTATPASEDYSGVYSGRAILTYKERGILLSTSESNLSQRIEKDSKGHYWYTYYFNSDKKVIVEPVKLITGNENTNEFKLQVIGNNLTYSQITKTYNKFVLISELEQTGTLTKQ
jgi:galactose mutarotase-like enzyme